MVIKNMKVNLKIMNTMAKVFIIMRMVIKNMKAILKMINVMAKVFIIIM